MQQFGYTQHSSVFIYWNIDFAALFRTILTKASSSSHRERKEIPRKRPSEPPSSDMKEMGG